MMLKRLKKLFAEPASDAASPAPSELPVNDFALVDACLSGWFDVEGGQLLKGFPIRAQDRVLDIGCGDGQFSHFCAKMGAELIFGDIDAERVARVADMLQGSAARALHPLVTDANPLPLPDAHLDKIIAMEVLEHVDVPSDFMCELVRVGKPGAQYLLSVPDARSEGVQEMLAPAAHFQKPNHINIFGREEFERLVTNSGLIVEQRTYYGFYWAVWWAFFWVCRKDLSNPDHPLLNNWAKTWASLMDIPEGARVKRALDEVMPKSQAIIARKPY